MLHTIALLTTALAATGAPLPAPHVAYAAIGSLTVFVGHAGTPLVKQLGMQFKTSAGQVQQTHQMQVETGALASTQWVLSADKGQAFVWAALPNLRMYMGSSEHDGIVRQTLQALSGLHPRWVRGRSDHERIGGMPVTSYVFHTQSHAVQIEGTAWLDRDNVTLRCWLRARLPNGGVMEVNMDLGALQKGMRVLRLTA